MNVARELHKFVVASGLIAGMLQHDALAEPTYGLVASPGIFRDDLARGAELSVLGVGNDQGAFSFAGLVYGRSLGGCFLEYAEIEAGGSGWGLLTVAGGIGRWRSLDSRGYQATASIQFFTPFFVYARYRRTFDRGFDRDVGLMVKLPLAVGGTPRTDPDDWVWGGAFLD